MEVKGTYTFDRPASPLWEFLLDPNVIVQCLPGCNELRPLGDDRYQVTLSVAVAAVTGSYQGVIAVTDKIPPHSYRLVVEGSGRPGFVKGHALISLSEQATTTVVDVVGEVEVGGLIARVGQRLLASVSKMMMDRFYACLQQKAASGA